MTTLEIIGAPQSTYVRTVRMALEEKGVNYTLTPARPHSPEADAIHPFGKVPVMRHGDFTLFESKAIATYADRAFPGVKLFPDDARLCGTIEQWTSVLNTTVFPVFLPYLRAYFIVHIEGGEPDRGAIGRAVADVRAHIAVLDKAVSASGHLAGAGFTYADMALMPWLFYLRDLPESGEALAAARSLTAYYKLHCERSSFSSTVPPLFSELRR
jgi:glutathione S-transferase